MQKRPAQACREYGLADSVLSRWCKEYQERGEAAFSSQSGEATTQEQRIPELECLCGQLALESPAGKCWSQLWKLLSKGLASTGGSETKEATNMELQAHRMSLARKVGKGASISAMNMGGGLSTGWTDGFCVSRSEHQNQRLMLHESFFERNMVGKLTRLSMWEEN